MGLGSRGFLAVLALGAVLAIALLKIVADSTDLEESADKKNSMSLKGNGADPTALQVPLGRTNESSNFTVKLSATQVSPVSKVTTTTSKPIAKSSTTPVSSKNSTTPTLKTTAKPSTTPVSSVSKNATAATLKPIATTKMTPQVSTNTTSTTIRSTPKITGVSQNISQMSTSTMNTTHNSSVTSVSPSVTITATINSKENKGSKFDTGSFVGGIVLTLGVLSFLYIGCKMYYSRRGIRYRTIDEHDAII
uniref:Transmembrane protein 123 n=1 Tax=Sus scrofa TaxID=9823 RepID=A0A4X1TRE3_PIG